MCEFPPRTEPAANMIGHLAVAETAEPPVSGDTVTGSGLLRVTIHELLHIDVTNLTNCIIAITTIPAVTI